MKGRRTAIEAREMTPELQKFALCETDPTPPPPAAVSIATNRADPQPPRQATGGVAGPDETSNSVTRQVRINRGPNRKHSQRSLVSKTPSTTVPASVKPESPQHASRTSGPVEWKQYSGRLTAATLRRFKTFCLRRELAGIYPYRQQELLEAAVVALLAKSDTTEH